MKTNSIVLTIEQAIDAIQIDFRQYAPQLMLFSAILKLITGHNAYLTNEPSKNGAWLHEPGRQKLRWLDKTELVAYMCKILAEAELSPELLASICSRVFQNKAVVQIDPHTGGSVIRIQTGMEAFECKQCGQCCRSLDYHDELTAEDVAQWKAMGRNDILDWVGIFKANGIERITYRIWMPPGTRKLAETCPFLKKVPTQNRWICQIHADKPTICRNYPVSRKHAMMTGCPGFN